ncbi:MAG: hypothetical protein ABI178_09500 [Rhodanobacter sp.]
MAAQQLVKDRAESVDIRRRGQVTASRGEDFRSHITRRADHRIDASQRTVDRQPPCKPEIRDQRLIGGIEHDIRRFQIAMEHAVTVGVSDRAGDQGNESRALAELSLQRRNALGQVAAFGELHAEVRKPGVGADLVDRQDTRVIEAGHQLGLAAKTVERIPRFQPPGQQHLQRDLAVEIGLPGAIDDADTTTVDLTEQVIATDDLLDARPRIYQVGRTGGAACVGARLGLKRERQQATRAEASGQRVVPCAAAGRAAHLA